MESTLLWVGIGGLAISLTSAVVPWVNAEVLVVSLATVADTRVELALLVLIVTVGQMAGKCVVYWAGRRGAARPSPRVAVVLERWRARLTGRRWAALGLVFASSSLGVPPFYLMSLLAGAMRVNFAHYLLWGTAGRLVRFGATAAVAFAAIAR